MLKKKYFACYFFLKGKNMLYFMLNNEQRTFFEKIWDETIVKHIFWAYIWNYFQHSLSN